VQMTQAIRHESGVSEGPRNPLVSCCVEPPDLPRSVSIGIVVIWLVRGSVTFPHGLADVHPFDFGCDEAVGILLWA
jgi:hypothetical protein